MGSKEYRKFLEGFSIKKMSLYEKVCNILDKVRLPMPESMRKKYREEIDFCHLNVTPNGVFVTSIAVPIFTFVLFTLFFTALGKLSIGLAIMNLILSSIIFYYLFTYIHFHTLYFRSSAASEMALSIVYMVVSLRTSPNLERAIAFTASNLSGPLGTDFKKVLWDIEIGKYLSVTDAINDLANKWKSESQEFVDAISLIKTSIGQTPTSAEKSLNEALSTMLYGTKERMKKYALNMRTPLNILYAFGILLPMLTLIFIPMVIIFLPEYSQPELLAFFYTIVLPASVFLFLRQYFYARPYSFHQVEIKNLQSFKEQKKITALLIGAISIPLTIYILYLLSLTASVFSIEQFFLSLATIVILAFSLSAYFFITSYSHMERNEDIIKIENELPVVLFQLGSSMRSGKPIETVIDEIKPKIREMKISNFFNDTISNIKFGMTFEKAIFDERQGAIKKYPSRILSAIMKAITDIASKGASYLSNTMTSISTYLKEAEEVKNATDEILSEITSQMYTQAIVFAPVAMAIVVSLMALVLYVFSFFSYSIEDLQKFLGSGGVGTAAMSGFQFLFQLGKQIPFHYFQIMVGVYLVETIFMLTYFLGALKYGDDEINKMQETGKIMFIGIVIYAVITILVYLFIVSFMNLSQLS